MIGPTASDHVPRNTELRALYTKVDAMLASNGATNVSQLVVWKTVPPHRATRASQRNRLIAMIGSFIKSPRGTSRPVVQVPHLCPDRLKTGPT